MIDRFFMWCLEMSQRLRSPAIVYEPIRTYDIPLWQVFALLTIAGQQLRAGVSFEALYLALSRDAPKHDQPQVATQQPSVAPAKRYIGEP